MLAAARCLPQENSLYVLSSELFMLRFGRVYSTLLKTMFRG